MVVRSIAPLCMIGTERALCAQANIAASEVRVKVTIRPGEASPTTGANRKPEGKLAYAATRIQRRSNDTGDESDTDAGAGGGPQGRRRGAVVVRIARRDQGHSRRYRRADDDR